MVYIVQPGDTLHSIASRFGITADALCTYNDLPNCNLIYPGQELLIPTPEVTPPAETPSPTTSQTIYTVQPGTYSRARWRGRSSRHHSPLPGRKSES